MLVGTADEQFSISLIYGKDIYWKPKKKKKKRVK